VVSHLWAYEIPNSVLAGVRRNYITVVLGNSIYERSVTTPPAFRSRSPNRAESTLQHNGCFGAIIGSMRILLLALLIATSLEAADQQKLALETAADADFARVASGIVADFSFATKCVQSEAMAAAVATREQVPEVTFRKAFCQLAAAAATGDRASFEKAADTFDDAIADAQSPAGKQKIPVLAPPTWHILAAVARLNAGAEGDSEENRLRVAIDAANCRGVPPQLCQSIQQLGSAWLGRIALVNGDRPAASRWFANSDVPEWKAWASGRQAYEVRNYREAAVEYGRAIGLWRARLPSSLSEQLNPRPEMSRALTDWGGAQLASGDAAAALANFDAAIKADKANARAYYLRALAEQRSGREGAATEDFDLASRAALAQTGADATARAHFYRGIVFYRRKEFVRAEQEFSSALSVDGSTDWQADARAWRFLAAVAGGACGASRENLGRAEGSASPYFPKQLADAAMAACPVTSAEPGAR
jgi:hypothetical protein